jgi:PAS domain-containing protein
MERLRAERRLRQGERRRDALLKALPDMVFHVGRDGSILDFHPGTCAKPLVPPDQFLERRMGDLLPADVAREGMHAVAGALDGGGMRIWKYALDGRAYEARIVASGPDEAVCFVRDVTPS